MAGRISNEKYVSAESRWMTTNFFDRALPVIAGHAYLKAQD